MPTGYPGDAFVPSLQELHDHFGIEHSAVGKQVILIPLYLGITLSKGAKFQRNKRS